MYQSREGTEIKRVNEYISIEDGCSTSDLETIQTLLGYLPPALFEAFREENGQIIIVSDLKGDCIGSTEITDEGITIYMKDGYEFDVLMHEFGHVYLHFNPEQMNDTFKELYEIESKSLVNAYYGDSPYYYSDETEFFAQAFQTVLVMGGHDTQEAAPKTFSYMTELITSMFNQNK